MTQKKKTRHNSFHVMNAENEIRQLELEITQLHDSLPSLLQSCSEDALFGPIADALGIVLLQPYSSSSNHVNHVVQQQHHHIHHDHTICLPIECK
jgi:hypothetical protein